MSNRVAHTSEVSEISSATTSAEPKKGFAAAKSTPGLFSAQPAAPAMASGVTVSATKPNVIMSKNKTCPTDPAELNQCDSCQ